MNRNARRRIMEKAAKRIEEETGIQTRIATDTATPFYLVGYAFNHLISYTAAEARRNARYLKEKLG